MASIANVENVNASEISMSIIESSVVSVGIQKIQKIKEELSKLRQHQEELGEKYGEFTPPEPLTREQKAEADTRSVYVTNVGYNATTVKLTKLFSVCGSVKRVTIMKDRITGQPKGFAYVEFADVFSAKKAISLTRTVFLDRQIAVCLKRTIQHGFIASVKPQQPRVGSRRGGFSCGSRGRGAPRGRRF